MNTNSVIMESIPINHIFDQNRLLLFSHPLQFSGFDDLISFPFFGLFRDSVGLDEDKCQSEIENWTLGPNFFKGVTFREY